MTQARASSRPDGFTAASTAPVELLAPAGGPEAAFAAFHFGADAIYLGLKKFSARAEAENFTLAELSEVTAYAHSLSPRRRVFVAINTLIRQDELHELIETMAAVAEIGVDAVILQDLGVYHLARKYFPDLELHASTQLAIHNQAGAQALGQLGFSRVVLARELTLEEVRDVTQAAEIETEVFIHGALCYSYSGLCLFSSQTLGRSGNRGRCAYSCRDSYEVEGAPALLGDGTPVKRDPAEGFPFSMKDLALPDHLPALRAAGVACFKIEGRKKSPLYVATTTDYYRKLIDGTLNPQDRPLREADLQSVFSRPWTQLFALSHRDKEVADRDTVGHRGTPIGRIEAVIAMRGGRPRLRFRTARRLERHDGLQIDLPILAKPFGFPVDRLWILDKRQPSGRQEVLAVPAGSRLEVELPADAPDLAAGATVYCSSSQAVKQCYRHERPRMGQCRTRLPLDLELHLTEQILRARVTWSLPALGLRATSVTGELPGPFEPARDPAALALAARDAFQKLGDTSFTLRGFRLDNPEGRFVPASRLNAFRRQLLAGVEQSLQDARSGALAQMHTAALPAQSQAGNGREFRWSIKLDRVAFADAFEAEDWAAVDEVVIDLARDPLALLNEALNRIAGAVGKDRIRLALPALVRKWEDRSIRQKVDSLLSAGWFKWEAANLSAWSYLGIDPAAGAAGPIDLATDWSVYVVNRLAAQQLLAMGVSRFALSPEDGQANIRSLLAEYGPAAVVIVFQDTPVFISESCAYANLIGGCPGKANCRFESMEMVSSHGERVTALDYHCRTIVLNQGPYCLSTRLRELARIGATSLRADFVYRNYAPPQVRDIWRAVRAGKPIRNSHDANFDKGMQ